MLEYRLVFSAIRCVIERAPWANGKPILVKFKYDGPTFSASSYLGMKTLENKAAGKSIDYAGITEVRDVWQMRLT